MVVLCFPRSRSHSLQIKNHKYKKKRGKNGKKKKKVPRAWKCVWRILSPFMLVVSEKKKSKKKNNILGTWKCIWRVSSPKLVVEKKTQRKPKKKTYWGPENMSVVFWAPGLVVSEKKKKNKEKRKKMSYLMLVVKNRPLGLVFWARVGSGLLFWVRKKELTPPSRISSKGGVSVVVVRKKRNNPSVSRFKRGRGQYNGGG